MKKNSSETSFSAFRRALLRIAQGLLIGTSLTLCAEQSDTVVVYSSEDQVCSQPILQDFQKETGIRVEAVYDKEAAEVVMKRLLAEKDKPQADVYWANEPIHPDLLKERRVSTPYVSPNSRKLPSIFREPEGYWTAFSARTRVLLVGGSENSLPTSVEDYADPRWKGRAILANPLLNTTGFTITALFQLWGTQRAQRFLQSVKDNDVRFSPGNGDSADAVAADKVGFSLVDIDDAFSAIAKAAESRVVYPDQQDGQVGVFLVANAVSLIRGGPNPYNGRKLIDYLLTAKTQRKLAFSPCAQTPLLAGVETPERVQRIENLKYMKVDYSQIRKQFETLKPSLEAWASSLRR